MSSDGNLILRLTGVEAAVNAASNTTVSNSSFVRVLNTSAAALPDHQAGRRFCQLHDDDRVGWRGTAREGTG
jgi:hypothetical protein